MSTPSSNRLTLPAKRLRGRPPRPVVLHPEPLWPVTDHPPEFHEALALHMARHGDTAHRLHRALAARGVSTDRKTLFDWRRGVKEPQTGASLEALGGIEDRYRLEPGYLASRMGRRRAIGGQVPADIGVAEARRLAWHLPDDFRRRPLAEQTEILDWVRTRVLGGGTAYTRYHAEVSKHRFGLQFDETVLPGKEGRRAGCPELKAPVQLQDEMRALVRFKSATLTDIGYQRSGVWGPETAAQRGEHLALMFGAMGRLCLSRPARDAGGRPQCAGRTLPWARDRVCIGGKGAPAPSGEGVPCSRRGPRRLSGFSHERAALSE